MIIGDTLAMSESNAVFSDPGSTPKSVASSIPATICPISARKNPINPHKIVFPMEEGLPLNTLKKRLFGITSNMKIIAANKFTENNDQATPLVLNYHFP